ncbi:MBL fold metallo-hydrolase [Longispora sp. K20-0274]|uniref:MBL fold metallo-hydrolase n=1 Tax=Longispora sp. K20-0274 TaxID=3088255 RepID=UPI00399C1686
MELTKYTHACVRLESAGGVLVVDPGVWAEPEALVGAHAVLLTHEHGDHADIDRLRALDVPIFAPAGADLDGLPVTPVRSGEEFTAAGFRIRPVGGQHAKTYGGLPACANLGYVVDDRVYHPGDSFDLPEQSVETLLLPLGGPWWHLDAAIDFAKAVKAERTIPIHDGMYAERALPTFDGWLEEFTDVGYVRVRPGDTV